MKIGIIGASGFIGLNLTHFLSGHSSHEVIPTTRQSSYKPPFASPIEWQTLQLEPSKELQLFLSSVDAVVYLAHQGIPTKEGSWHQEVSANLSPLLKFLEQVTANAENAKRPKPLKLIYLSSGGTIYGISKSQIAWKESDLPLPNTVYGISKLSGEHFIRNCAELGYCQAACLRVANPYGNRFPHIKEQGIIDVAAARIKQDRPLNLFAPRDQIRDFIHIDDLNRAIEAALDLNSNFEIFNIGSGIGSSIGAVISELEKASGKNLKIEITQPENLQKVVPWSVLDISRAKAKLNWKPEMALSNGIQSLFVKAPR